MLTPSSTPPTHSPTTPSRLTLEQAWPEIMKLFDSPTNSSIASIDPDGQPHITPIGSIMLRPDRTGMFIEKFTTTLPGNIDRDNRICVYASRFSWASMLAGMLRGGWATPIAVRLYGCAGPRRPLTDAERTVFERKVRWLKPTPGFQALWADMTHARDITFHRYAPVLAGKMTRGHWRQRTPDDHDTAQSA